MARHTLADQCLTSLHREMEDLSLAVGAVTRALAGLAAGGDDIVEVSSIDQNLLLGVVLASWRCGAAASVSPRVDGTFATIQILTSGGTLSAQRLRSAPGLLLQKYDALYQRTSGSTAESKLVVRTVQSLLVEWEGYVGGLSLSPESCVGVPLSVSHSFGMGIALAGLSSGSVVQVGSLMPVRRWASALDGRTFTHIACTPTVASLLSAVPGAAARTTATTMVVGAGQASESLKSRIRERFACDICLGYGSTETGGTFLGMEGLGDPIPGVTISEPQAGSMGELVLEFDYEIPGYPLERRTSTSWRTGDLVQRDHSGVVRFQRRIVDLRVNGVTIGDAGFHDTLRKHFQGRFEVVVRMNECKGYEVMHLFAEIPVDVSVVSAALVRQYGVSPMIHPIDALPLDNNGKLDRRRLESYADAGSQ